MDILNPVILRINNDILMMQRNDNKNIGLVQDNNYYHSEYIICIIALILLFVLCWKKNENMIC